MNRADVLLVEGGWVSSRAQAARIIKQGGVRYGSGSDWQVLSKPSLKLPDDIQFQLDDLDELQYVSRGALKLKAAVEFSGIELTGKSALDVGQSTGGFTDYLVQSGIKRVVGVDVGRDQLDGKLREHPKVTCLEGVNARELPETLLDYEPQGFDVIVMDVSFISQSLILPNLGRFLKPKGFLISLVKPQFEVGKENIGKGGLVRDAGLYPQVKARIQREVEALGFEVQGYLESPIKGGDGNREFLLIAQRVN